MNQWVSSRRLRWALCGLLIGAGVAMLRTLGLDAQSYPAWNGIGLSYNIGFVLGSGLCGSLFGFMAASGLGRFRRK